MIPRYLKIGVGVLLVAVLGLSGYLWRLKRHAANAPQVIEAVHVAPPPAGPKEQVTLYVAYDDPGIVLARGASIPLPQGRQERAQEVLQALLNRYLEEDSSHPLAPGSEIRNVYLVDPGMAVIDVNSALANGHRSGILVEELTIVSLVQTLSTNVPGINRVKILVDGKERETLAGHADLSTTYDTANVQQLVDQLKSAN
jgi:Sporulation and spore germination